MLEQEQVLQDQTQDQSTQEQTVQEPLVPEIAEAFKAEDVAAALAAIKTTDTALAVHITIATTLLNLLGAEHPSTVAAMQSLRTYKPKGSRVSTPKAFNANAAIRKLIYAKDYAGLAELKADERIPAAIRTHIVTVATLHEAGMPDNIMAVAVKSLRAGVTPQSKGSRAPAAKFDVVYNGKAYSNLMDALEAAGYSKDIPEGANKSPATSAWNKTRKHLLRDGTATLDGHVFTRSAPADEETAEVA